MSKVTYTDYYQSDLGYWTIEAHDEALINLRFQREIENFKINPNPITKLTTQQLQEYFSGKRKTFDLPLDTNPYSDFYKQVWTELQSIPYGQTVSYTHIATQIQNPKAVRAVGMANGRNPFAIIVPCHRIIGKNKKLTGYAHGLDVKRWLLEHEGALKKELTLF